MITEDSGDFDGAFAKIAFKEGDLIEKGVMRRLPYGFDGNTCPYIFTWSEEVSDMKRAGLRCALRYKQTSCCVANAILSLL